MLYVHAEHNIDTPMFQDVDCSVCVCVHRAKPVWDIQTFLQNHQTSMLLNTCGFIWNSKQSSSSFSVTALFQGHNGIVAYSGNTKCEVGTHFHTLIHTQGQFSKILLARLEEMGGNWTSCTRPIETLGEPGNLEL